VNPRILLAIGGVAVGLTGCVGEVAVRVPDHHPASPRAAPGLVEAPSALSAYKAADEFEHPLPAAAGMSGMDHGSMPGMQHGGAPPGASAR
jgi:hypothetical protein